MKEVQVINTKLNKKTDSVMAQSESENISANVKWGVRQRMKNGTFSFHFNTYGYRKGENGEPEVVPEEAEYIRKMFDLYTCLVV